MNQNDLVPLMNTITKLEAENAYLKEALGSVRKTTFGQVCNTYEVCGHKACQASYGAWAISDKALKGE